MSARRRRNGIRAILRDQIEIVIVGEQRAREGGERAAPRNVQRAGHVRAREAIGCAHVDDERAREPELRE